MFFGGAGATTMSPKLQKRYKMLTKIFKCSMAGYPGAILLLALLDDIVTVVVSQTDTHQSIRVSFHFFLWEKIVLALSDITMSIILTLMFCIPLMVLSAQSAKSVSGGTVKASAPQQQDQRAKTRRLRDIAKANLNWSVLAMVSTTMFVTFCTTLLPENQTVWMAIGGVDVSFFFFFCNMCKALPYDTGVLLYTATPGGN
jgi:hypothetical protein